MTKLKIVNDDYGTQKLKEYMREDHGQMGSKDTNRITSPGPVDPSNRPDGDALLPLTA